ncbi:MAG: sigma-70 family RNA polymerase sigma factor [Bacteroidales bacterium]|jgi:RNA polymerase sigma-70 factor (ECF subfamily)|nr:sigma-70 family RNA polymerase sigma factor [Bacteroidales bacterium]MBO7255776.1 sigma-70 family RNA polymerase sigma factor [Bacteroidales bacterium]MBO7284172.1 sigma-70 family RNA polymerase sigma factor [Bacteroidales bacterium]MBO7322643.1 sigma-70 family RNA polymerase sigma factor [Bacteroidales bacterium]MBQ1279517.1 sigma-70 family RNA polymerase sigma factor [Bacteroidales bacterium]
MITEKQFAQIVAEHKKTIYTVCYMFSKEKGEIDDLFQEILINIYNGLEHFRNQSELSTWIWRISLNTCISAERKKNRKKSREVPLSVNINLFTDDDNDTRQVRILKERISKLGIFDRAIILLWLENLSYDEIAAIVGISVKNVSVRLVRIKEELKRM